MKIDVGQGLLLDAEKQLFEIQRADYEDSLYDFLRDAWRFGGVDSAPWMDSWAIEAVAEHLQAVVDGDIRRLLINIPPRFGKLLADDTPVLTKNGWRNHGDLVVGDEVFHPSGRSIKVIGVSDKHNADVRVEFFDGSTFWCHQEHEWTLFNRTTRRWETVEARRFLGSRHGRWGQTNGTCKSVMSGGRALHQLPPVQPLRYPKADLPLHPYVLGAWLGDGSSRGAYITHAASDQPYIDKIVRLGFSVSVVWTHKDTGVLTTSFGVGRGKLSPLSLALRTAGVLNDKHIPEAYLRASIEQRLELLAGLIDTDGTVDKSSRCTFVTGNKRLADGVEELVRSFGWRATVCEVQPEKRPEARIQGKKPYWMVAFQPDMAIPVALPRKQIRRFATKRAIGLKSVELDPCGKVGRCIQVDSPDGLYLIGRNLIPTHNSTLTSVAFPAWTWAQPFSGATSGPGVQFLCASYGNPLALRDSVKCRRLIEGPWYQKFWGERFNLNPDQNTKSRFGNNRGGERLITSVDAGVTGEGGDIIIIDDPNAANEAFSEATIKATIDWWEGTMSTRLNNIKTGAFVVIQQRLAENDLSGHILEHEAKDWEHLCLPMEFEPERSFHTVLKRDPETGAAEDTWVDPRTEPGELLAPSRFSKEDVERLARRLGPYKAAGQLQQRPEPAGGGIIKREWWKLWEGESFPPMDFILASLDTAYTEKEENDPSAMTIWGVFSDPAIAQTARVLDPDTGQLAYDERLYQAGAPKLMLMYAWDEHLELHQLVTKTAEVCKRFKVDKLLIENKAAGISVGQELKRLHGRERWAVQLNDPKSQDKRSRLYSVQHIFAEGMVYAPDKKWAERVFTQVGQFPKGKHDDLVDTVSQGVRHLRDLGLLERTEERLHDEDAAVGYPGSDATALYPV